MASEPLFQMNQEEGDALLTHIHLKEYLRVAIAMEPRGAADYGASLLAAVLSSITLTVYSGIHVIPLRR